MSAAMCIAKTIVGEIARNPLPFDTRKEHTTRRWYFNLALAAGSAGQAIGQARRSENKTAHYVVGPLVSYHLSHSGHVLLGAWNLCRLGFLACCANQAL